MTVITPEMEKKQEEAMDKFLAKQATERRRNLYKLSLWMRINYHHYEVRRNFKMTYIPIVFHLRRTYKEQEQPKSFPIKLICDWADIYDSAKKTYRQMPRLRICNSTKDFYNKSLSETENRYLSTIHIEGFSFHDSTGYFVSPEGWTPPPEWNVKDHRVGE